MRLHLADAGVLVLYFILTVGTGLYVSRRSTSTESFFLGRRDFPGWVIGISFIGAMVSSVTFIAFPADAFKTAWVRFLPNLAFPLVVLLSTYAFIPFFRRGRINSAYHYLGLRFGPSVATYAAGVYVVAQLIRSATISYLVAMLLMPLTGWPIGACLVLSGGVSAVYTITGGFEAVVWTDLVQTIVLVAGALACVIAIVHAVPGGLGGIWAEGRAAGKLSLMDLNPRTGRLEPIPRGFSLTEKTSVMLILAGFSQYVAGKLDQSTVQRWCSAKSDREAKKSMLVLGAASLPIWAGFMFLGTCLWVYYRHFPTDVAREILGGSRKAEEILPYFVMTALPPGLAGLVIAAALAAAMSTLSSSINSATMVGVNDLYRVYFAKGRDDRHYLRASRGASFAFSIAMVGIAYLFYRAQTKTIVEFGLIITALFGGGISGAFLFGMLTRAGDERSVLLGIGVTLLFTLYATLAQFGILPRLFDPYYTSILGNLVMFGTCCVASRVLPYRPRDLANLTLWDRHV